MESVGSLPVANVQALAYGLTEVPSRYVRPEVNVHPAISDGGLEIPIIDLSRLLDSGTSEEESSRLHLACQDWGFFQLINHKITHEVIGRMKFCIEEFFKLPLDEKLQFAQTPNNFEGYGQLFVVSEDQKLDWADMLFLKTWPVPERNMRFWPNQPSTFRSALDEYSVVLKDTTDSLLHFIAKNLGLNMEIIADKLKTGLQSVRFNFYPPCPQAHKVLGLSQHSDSGLITLVLQVNEVQGLQIRKNGGWIPVKPLPGAFIVNVGDTLEIFSNGRYKSIEHRAVVNTERERLSIAAFHNPKSDAMIGPFPELVEGSQVKYKTVDHESFRKLFFSLKLDGKGFLDRMKLKA